MAHSKQLRTVAVPVDPTPSTPPAQAAREYVGSFVVIGQAASKANSRRLVLTPSRSSGGHVFVKSRKTGQLRTGQVRFIKSAAANTYADLVRLQVRRINPPLTGDVCLNIHMYYATRRPDMDESALLDAIQGIIYENDRQVKERHTYWHLDKHEPRVEVDIYLLHPEGE